MLTFFEYLGGAFGGNVSLLKLAGLVLALAWLVALVESRWALPFLPRDQPLVGWLTIAFVAWAGASAAWAADVGVAIDAVFRLMQVIALLFIAFSAMREARHVRWMVWAFLTGAFATAFFGLVTGKTDDGTERLSAGIFDPNFLAAVLVPSLLLASFLFFEPGRRGRTPTRLLLALYCGIYLVSLVRTESRGGLIALAVGLTVAILVGGPARSRLVVMALVVAAAAFGYFALAASSDSVERLRDFSAEGSSGRSDQWRIALEVIEDNPMVGVGLDNFRIVEPAYISQAIDLVLVRQLFRLQPNAHNTYLDVAADLGLPALATFLALLLSAFWLVIRSLRAHPDSELAFLVRGLIPATAAALVAYFFLSGLYEKHLWLLLGLMFAAGTVEQPLRAGAAAARPTRDLRRPSQDVLPAR